MAARPVRRKSSSRGGARRRQELRGSAPARQPVRVSVKRLERAAAALRLPYSLTPGKEIRVMVDAGVVSLALDGGVLRVGAWWLERAPLSLEVPLLVVANSWNRERGVPVAGVTDVENGDALLVCGSRVVPVGAGLGDAQLLHVVEEAVDDCVGLLRHLEELFPQTRFDGMAGALGLRGEKGGVLEPSTEESAQQARELVAQAREVAESDPDGASALLVGAVRHARRAGLGPQEVGAAEVLAAVLERSLVDEGVAGASRAVGESLLEAVRRGAGDRADREGGREGEKDLGGEVAQPAPSAQRSAGAGTRTSSGGGSADEEDAQGVTAARVGSLLVATGRKVSGALEERSRGGRADGAQPEDEPVLVEVGGILVRVAVEGDDLVLCTRWDAGAEGRLGEDLVEAALLACAGWNRAGRVLGARVVVPGGLGETLPQDDEAAEASTARQGAGAAQVRRDGAADQRDQPGQDGREGLEGLAVEGYARWCVAPGASDSQLSHMVEAALVEVEYLARYCADHVVVGPAGAGETVEAGSAVAGEGAGEPTE